MKCPNCNVLISSHTGKVVDSRPTYLSWVKLIGSGDQIDATRRRRICLQCNHAWTTYEITREEFDRLESVERRNPKTHMVIEAYSKAIEALEQAMAAALEKEE